MLEPSTIKKVIKIAMTEKVVTAAVLKKQMVEDKTRVAFLLGAFPIGHMQVLLSYFSTEEKETLIKVVLDLPYISEKDHVNYWQCFAAEFYEEVKRVSVQDQSMDVITQLLFAHPKSRLRCLFENQEES